MAHSIDFRPSALKSFYKIPRREQQRISAAIELLRLNPHPPGAKKLEGEYDLWRIRVGTYRVVYTIEEERLLILVLKVGHRKDVYR